MYKKLLLSFLSVLLLMTGCTESTVPAEKPATDKNDISAADKSPHSKDQVQQLVTPDIQQTTSSAIDSPSLDVPEAEEQPTKNPEETLNDILHQLHELEELMDGT